MKYIILILSLFATGNCLTAADNDIRKALQFRNKDLQSPLARICSARTAKNPNAQHLSVLADSKPHNQPQNICLITSALFSNFISTVFATSLVANIKTRKVASKIEWGACATLFFCSIGSICLTQYVQKKIRDRKIDIFRTNLLQELENNKPLSTLAWKTLSADLSENLWLLVDLSTTYKTDFLKNKQDREKNKQDISLLHTVCNTKFALFNNNPQCITPSVATLWNQAKNILNEIEQQEKIENDPCRFVYEVVAVSKNHPQFAKIKRNILSYLHPDKSIAISDTAILSWQKILQEKTKLNATDITEMIQKFSGHITKLTSAERQVLFKSVQDSFDNL